MDDATSNVAAETAWPNRAADVEPFIEGLSVKQALALESLTRGETLAKASRVAGVTRKTLYDWLEQGTAFSKAYDQWKRALAETSRTRLLMIGEAATMQIARAIINGDTRAALAVAKGMGLLSPPPVGPSLAQIKAENEAAKPSAAQAREFHELILGLTDEIDGDDNGSDTGDNNARAIEDGTGISDVSQGRGKIGDSPEFEP